MSFDWCRVWWRNYGQGRTLRLFVFRVDGQLVGLAPMFVERVRLGPVSLKIGKRVGADYALSIFSLPIAPDHARSIYTHVLSRLVGIEKCDAVWIGLCPGDDPTIAGLKAASTALEGLASVISVPSAPAHTVFDLPSTFATYLDRLDARTRQNYIRRLKNLNKHFEVENEVVSDSLSAKQLFDEFLSAHAAQWTAKRKLGHFGDWPRASEFNAELVESQSKSGRFRMLRMKANGAVVSKRPFVHLRYKLFRLMSQGIEFAYYRFWFRRCARFFTPFRRPLWHTWIRTHL
jgi:hypothetical protein